MAMVDESARMMAAADPGLQSAVGDEDKCDTCKLIVTQVATMLRNPVRTNCNFFAVCAALMVVCARFSLCQPGEDIRHTGLTVSSASCCCTTVILHTLTLHDSVVSSV